MLKNSSKGILKPGIITIKKANAPKPRFPRINLPIAEGANSEDIPDAQKDILLTKKSQNPPTKLLQQMKKEEAASKYFCIIYRKDDSCGQTVLKTVIAVLLSPLWIPLVAVLLIWELLVSMVSCLGKQVSSCDMGACIDGCCDKMENCLSGCEGCLLRFCKKTASCISKTFTCVTEVVFKTVYWVCQGLMKAASCLWEYFLFPILQVLGTIILVTFYVLSTYFKAVFLGLYYTFLLPVEIIGMILAYSVKGAYYTVYYSLKLLWVVGLNLWLVLFAILHVIFYFLVVFLYRNLSVSPIK